MLCSSVSLTSLTLLALFVATCLAAVANTKTKPKANSNANNANADVNASDEREVLEGLPEACRQPPLTAAELKANKPAAGNTKTTKNTKEEKDYGFCTLRKPYYSEEDQTNHFCVVCKQNETASAAGKKPGVGPASTAAVDGTEVAKHLQQIVSKQLGSHADFDQNSGLTIIVHGVEKPVNITKALDDPNNKDDDVLHNLEEVLYMFKNKTIAKESFKAGESYGPLEEVQCTECEKQLKELKPQPAKSKQEQQQKRRDQEARQLQRQQSQQGNNNNNNEQEGEEEATVDPDEDLANEDDNSDDANGSQQQPVNARRQQEQYRQQQQRQREQQQSQQYDPRQRQQQQQQQRQQQYASGSGGASTKSVPAACKQDTHFTTEDGICSLHVPQSAELCITCKADRADAYQVLQSLDSLAQRLAPNNYQYISQNAEIVLVFDPAPRDNRVYDFSRELGQHQPLVQKLEEAYYFFPNQSVTVQQFDDYGRQDSLEPFNTYDDYLRRYQRQHEQQDNNAPQQQQYGVSNTEDDAASRDYNQEYYRRQQEQIRQQQQQQQQQARLTYTAPTYYGAPSTDAYGRVYPATRPAYDQQQQAEEIRRREQWREQQLRQQQQQQQQVQPTPTYYTPTIYASADYYSPRTTTQLTTTPAYGRTYAYTDRTHQPAYGTMVVSVVTLQPTTTITVTADQYGNIVRPTAYAPYIKPDQRGQKQTMCLVVETTSAVPQQQTNRNERSSAAAAAAQSVRAVPYAGQPGIYERG